MGQPEAALVAVSANLLYVKNCEVFGGAGSATWFREDENFNGIKGAPVYASRG